MASAVLVTAGLHAALPDRYRVQPTWLVPAVMVTLLAALIAGDPGRIDNQRSWLRVVTALIIVGITGANLAAAGRLVRDIITGSKTFSHSPGGLLATGTVVWLTNIVAFALWFWALDGGGAAARAKQPNRDPAFVFPEMQSDYVPEGWTPKFVDYLSLGFWTATAFSPTDVSAIKGWAKLLMMVEAFASLAIAAVVIARAINVL